MSPQADSCQFETYPKCAREEPSRCPNLTGSGVHGKGMVPNVRFHNNIVHRERASWEVPAKGAGGLDCWSCCCRQRERVCLKTSIRATGGGVASSFLRTSGMWYSSETICGIVDHVFQRRCAVGLASGEESCDCRQQIGQRAAVLWTLSRSRIRFDKDVD